MNISAMKDWVRVTVREFNEMSERGLQKMGICIRVRIRVRVRVRVRVGVGVGVRVKV